VLCDWQLANKSVMTAAVKLMTSTSGDGACMLHLARLTYYLERRNLANSPGIRLCASWANDLPVSIKSLFSIFPTRSANYY